MAGNDSYTKLLLHFNGDIVDSSRGASETHTFTAYGGAATQGTTKKFGSAALYLDGDGDYIDCPDSADWYLGDSIFCIDFWFKISSLNEDDYSYLLCQEDYYGNDALEIYLDSDGYVYADIGLGYASSDDPIEDTDWHHLAFLRYPNDHLYLFIDGVSQWDDINLGYGGNVIADSAGKLTIGRRGYTDEEYEYPAYFNGYIDELRFSVGTYRWDDDFTPETGEYTAPVTTTTSTTTTSSSSTSTTYPGETTVSTTTSTSSTVSTTSTTGSSSSTSSTQSTYPPPEEPYTKSLLHFDGEDQTPDFIDETGKIWTQHSGAMIRTTDPKFGSGCGSFGADGDYIETPKHADFFLGNWNFTIDFWIKRNFPVNVARGICADGDEDGNNGTFDIYLDEDGYVWWGMTYEGSVRTTGKITDYTTWHHIACVQNIDHLPYPQRCIYLDGVKGEVQSAWDGEYEAEQGITIGRIDQYTYLHGFVDEFRFSNGIARWTGDSFTPPTGPYMVEGQTTSTTTTSSTVSSTSSTYPGETTFSTTTSSSSTVSTTSTASTTSSSSTTSSTVSTTSSSSTTSSTLSTTSSSTSSSSTSSTLSTTSTSSSSSSTTTSSSSSSSTSSTLSSSSTTSSSSSTSTSSSSSSTTTTPPPSAAAVKSTDPVDGETAVSVNQPVQIKFGNAENTGDWVDLSTITVEVDGVVYDSGDPEFSYSGTPYDYVVSVTHPDWTYQQTVTVKVNATSGGGLPMDELTFSFTTEWDPASDRGGTPRIELFQQGKYTLPVLTYQENWVRQGIESISPIFELWYGRYQYLPKADKVEMQAIAGDTNAQGKEILDEGMLRVSVDGGAYEALSGLTPINLGVMHTNSYKTLQFKLLAPEGSETLKYFVVQFRFQAWFLKAYGTFQFGNSVYLDSGELVTLQPNTVIYRAYVFNSDTWAKVDP